LMLIGGKRELIRLPGSLGVDGDILSDHLVIAVNFFLLSAE